MHHRQPRALIRLPRVQAPSHAVALEADRSLTKPSGKRRGTGASFARRTGNREDASASANAEAEAGVDEPEFRTSPREQIISTLVLNVSNWHFIRDNKSARGFVPCKPIHVQVGLKLSSTAFKTDKNQHNTEWYDRNGAIFPYAAFLSLIKDSKFTGGFMKNVKEAYEEDTGRLLTTAAPGAHDHLQSLATSTVVSAGCYDPDAAIESLFPELAASTFEPQGTANNDYNDNGYAGTESPQPTSEKPKHPTFGVKRKRARALVVSDDDDDDDNNNNDDAGVDGHGNDSFPDAGVDVEDFEDGGEGATEGGQPNTTTGNENVHERKQPAPASGNSKRGRR